MSDKLQCVELEAILCEYFDGALAGPQRQAVETHLAACPPCAELARDASAAINFIDRVSSVEIPPALVTRILQQTPVNARTVPAPRSRLSRWLGRLFEPVLQPRLVMGMAMTILSFAMLGRLAGIEVRQLRAADLNPVMVWEAFDDRLHRTWERGVKYYESLRLVYEIQSRLREWNELDDAAPSAPSSQSTSGSAQGPSSGAKPGESK